ncbi:MAG: anaerobic ribonucleoside-triphosphate reductase activating protein [Bacteroidales bacterium]|nr:anaerobic ribonucleoside-triphosphate reductase activating protein [Bacteroidales bacterium]
MKKNKQTIAFKLPIGGFQKQSLIDYPGNVSAIIFTQGCNFRCVYCHNPELVLQEQIKNAKRFNTEKTLNWINNNQKLLDAVVITGGEPTLHDSLPAFINRINQLGLKIKLDTNGTNPKLLKQLIRNKQLDYIAMDVKAPLELLKYREIVGENFNSTLMAKVIESIDILKSEGIEYEFRTTLDSLLVISDIENIIDSISGNYYLQLIHKDKDLQIDQNHFTVAVLKKIASKPLKNITIYIRE